MTRAFLLTAAVFFGCGKSLPEKPQLKLDRESIGFAQEFGSGTFIGTKPQESLILENGGLNQLTISSVELTGDSAFTKSDPTKTTLKANENAFIRIEFQPTAEKCYYGKLTIKSNAENSPSKDVSISGRGVKPGSSDAGVVCRLVDGGTP